MLILAAVAALAGCGKPQGVARPDAGHPPVRSRDGGTLASPCHSDADCDDHIPCTADFCDPVVGCRHQGNDALCDDRVACTRDACDPARGCVHEPDDSQCSDGVDCTADRCDPTAGCRHTSNDAACDDQNPCTADRCGAGGCRHAPVIDGTACDDGTLCNGRETCRAGACTPGTPPGCDDGNPCTADACDPLLGCTHQAVSNGAACDDNTVCNGRETCQSGTCTPGTPLGCTTTNPCQTASCDPVNGCVTRPKADGTACDDSTVCNGHETCQSGACAAGTPLGCDDGNPCTVDGCDGGIGCFHAPVVCPSDGVACTDDVCVPDGGCVHLANDAYCDGGFACKLGTCDPASGCWYFASNFLCADSAHCTGDYCDPSLGCGHVARSASCDDGNASTANVCSAASDCTYPATACLHPPAGDLSGLLPDGGYFFANGFHTGSTVGGTDSATYQKDSSNCPFTPNPGVPDAIWGLYLPNYAHVHLDTLQYPDGGGTSFDTVLYLRSACDQQTSQLACDDDDKLPDGGTPLQSGLDIDLSPGQYDAFVDGYSGTGNYSLNAQITPIDTCANAKDVGTGGTFTGDTLGLNDDYQPSSSGQCIFGGSGRDAVFKAVAPAGMTRMHLSTLGSAVDTLVYVRASPCASGPELGCNDDAKDAQGHVIGRYSDLTVGVTAGQTYFIVMDTYSASSAGSWVLNVGFLP